MVHEIVAKRILKRTLVECFQRNVTPSTSAKPPDMAWIPIIRRLGSWNLAVKRPKYAKKGLPMMKRMEIAFKPVAIPMSRRCLLRFFFVLL